MERLTLYVPENAFCALRVLRNLPNNVSYEVYGP